jgi:transcriptional regulator with XRE-family HTH domain
MKIGQRIRKIREIKGFSQENLAFELGMSLTGYGKIERDEVSLNFNKLEKIASVLGVNPETIIGFDENVAFNNFNSKIENQIGHNEMPKEMKELFQENINLLKDKISLLEDEIKRLKFTLSQS